jgi:Mn2+/Fe2+ NRAMP family transporter
VAAVEAGSHFGFDLVLPVLLLNFMAIVFQYACICTVTGNNLAKVNHLFPFIKQILYWGYRSIFFKMMANEI